MTKEEMEELEVLIPSKDVRNYIIETGWVFTDEQKAVLLVYGCEPLKEQHSHLQKLKNNTTDRDLQKRIAGYLNREDLRFQAFKENKDKAYIYILKVKEEDISYSSILPTEYFFDLDMAYECGRETDLPFMIEKYLVEAPEITGRYDPTTTFLEFDKDGEAVCFSGKIPDDEIISEDFQAFFEVPNPFEQGDIVRLAGTEDYGIVATPQEWWKRDLAKYKTAEWIQKGIEMDFSDAQIVVEFLNDDGTFSHAHINPICLERYQPKEDRKQYSPMDELLISASLLHQGEGSLDGLYFHTMKYREAKKQTE